jgi:nucleoside-diphosphate kinase
MNRKPSVSGAVVDGVDWSRWSIVLCKPDAVARHLVDQVIHRLTGPDAVLLDPHSVTVKPWQIHVHYWDLLVDADWFTGRDIPASLDAMYVGRTVAVTLAYGPPGIHGRLRGLLGHWDPSQAATGTIRGDLGDDRLEAALAERRLVQNLVHTSDDEDAARRDFGTWFGANRRALLSPPAAPRQRTPVEH